MGKQTVRQQARARARQARAKVREEREQRERRLSKLGEQVTVALAERDASEQRAGRALRLMVEDEGLRPPEALAWCGDEGLTAREAHRLIRAAAHDQRKDGAGEDQSVGPATAVPIESTMG
jgi:hypothetical protein